MSNKELVAHARKREGKMLRDEYRLDALIGIGGVAAVYRSTHRTGQRVAIKVLHPMFADDPQVTRRFLKEAYVANRVGHPGVVRILDDDVNPGGEAFLVMELLEGENCHDLWERSGGRVDPLTVATIGLRVLDVLARAHDRGVVHRDLKPENVFLCRSGQIKVLDFGLAHATAAVPSDVITKTGSVFGTPSFMPPEQALGDTKAIDGRTDLWALGAILFSLSSGRFVHGKGSVPELLARSAWKHAPLLATVAPDVPPPIAKVVDRALRLAPKDRYPRAAAMSKDLEKAVRSVFPDYSAAVVSDDETIMDEPPPPVRPRSSTGNGAARWYRSPWLLPLCVSALTVVVLTLLLAWLVVRRQPIPHKRPAPLAVPAGSQ